jgi:LuxR family maltose regulon positive regulatory protein
VGDDSLVTLKRAGSEELDAVVSLANDLTDVNEPVVMIVDDLHLARPSTEMLAAFISALPSHARAVFASRSAPPFPVSRLRVAGSLLELHADDLRLSLAESSAILANNGLHTAQFDVQRLHDLSEGWPAAVQLAAMSLRRSDDPEGFVHAFTATDRATSDFLVDEVLGHLPDEWVEFLSVTSVFEEFDVELCERLTGRPDAGTILADLANSGLLVVAVDESRHWFRYHHLLAAYMRARLGLQSPSRLRELHALASSLLEERGLVDGAMRQALAHNDTMHAASIVRRTLTDAGVTPDPELTATAAALWLHRVGDEMVLTDPLLVVELALAWIASAGADQGTRWLTKVELGNPDAPPVLAGHLHGAWAECLLNVGDVDAAEQRVQRASDSFDGDVPIVGMLQMLHALRARTELACGNVDSAREGLDRIMHRPLGSPALEYVRLPALRAWVACLDGDLGMALDLASSCLVRADELELSTSEPGRTYAWLTLAVVHAERMDDHAQLMFANARTSQATNARAWLQHDVAIEQAAHARAQGDALAAASYLTEARLLLSRPSPTVVAKLDLEATRQAIRFHRDHLGECADRTVNTAGSTVAQVELALAFDDREAARTLLAGLDAPSTTRQRIEQGVLAALAARDTADAVSALETVLELAESEGFVRTIVGAHERMRSLIAAVPVGAAQRAYIGKLVNISAAHVEPPRDIPPSTLIEPLSDREMTVLRYLSSRLTNQEIASALYISVNTLKTHIKSIYRKLAVASRSEAVEAARDEHLL